MKASVGDRLVESLRGLLEAGVEFDEAEEHLLSLVGSTADRLELLRAVLHGELSRDEVSTRRVAEISAEVRLLEKQLAGWCDSLRPKDEAVKSFQHQKAAAARWHRPRAV